MSNAADAAHGIITIQSQHSVAVTVQRLEGLLKERGIIVFAHIDFSADAARSGLTQRACALLLLGNPKSGTPLMLATPTARAITAQNQRDE